MDKAGGTQHQAPHHLVNIVTDRDIHESYDFTGPILGKGAFATVLRVRDRTSGSEYAVKQCDLTAANNAKSAIAMCERECRIMMSLSHPNIVRLQEVYRPPLGDQFYMVLDRLEGGSVDGLWREQGKLAEDHAAHIILQIISAVRYCHDRGIAHRDLKMENSLFEDSSLVPIVKVIDFGLSTELKNGVTSRAFVGTVLYTAPEILKVEGHGYACDLWSIGVMAYALVSGEFPWFSRSPDACGQMIKYSELKFPEEKWKGVSPLCRDFVEKCLVKAPKKRITAPQAQQHPWLRKAARDMQGAPLSKGAMMAMLDYQNGNAFKRVVMELVAYSYEPAQIKDLELEFLRMDKRGEGEINLQEFKEALMEGWAFMEEFPSVTASVSTPKRSRAEGLDTNIDPGCTTGSTTSTRSGSPVPRGGASDDPTSSVAICGGKPFSATWGGDDNGGAGAPGGVRQSAIESFWDGQRAAAAAPASQTSSSQRMASQMSQQPQRRPTQSKSQQQQLKLQRVTWQSGSESVREARVGSGVDGGALHAALLAAQSDDSVSRKGLDRMLNARKRRPLQEDSGTPPCEVEVDCGFGGKKMVSAQKRASVLVRKPLMDKSRVEEIFAAMDHDHSGSINFTDFVAGCLVEKQVGESALRTAFARLDHSRSGLISLEDVRMYLGEDFKEEELVRNMRAISSRDDGQVSYSDFKTCLLGGALPNSEVVTPAMSRSASFRQLSKLIPSELQGELQGLYSDEETPQGDLEAEEKAVLVEAVATATVNLRRG
ncbi:unnamed protein product [Laminaria digitata]